MGKRLSHLGKYAHSDNVDQVKDSIASKNCGNGSKESLAEATTLAKKSMSAKSPKPLMKLQGLIESGLDFICDMNGVKLFRKRK